MSFKILADSFSVARDSEHFLQLKSIKKPRSEEQVWLAIEIHGETRYARSMVQNMIETVEEVFFDKPDLSSYERFENTLKEINLIVKNLKEKRGPKAMGEVSAILAVVSGAELHLTQSKNAEAYLVRRGRLSHISEGLGGRLEDLFVNIASGEILPDDKIILATSRLLRVATHSQMVQILNEGVTEAVDAIRELVMSENELSLGAVCLHVKLPHRLGGALPTNKWETYLAPLKKRAEALYAWLVKKWGGKLPLPKLPALRGVGSLSRRSILVALMAAILILVISVSFLVDGRRNEALRQEYRQRIESMNQDLQVANTKGYAGEKETANVILDKVEREARDILGADFFRDEVIILLDKVQTTRDNINNTLRVKELKPYVDLAAKDPEVRLLGLVNLEDNFLAYEYNTLYEIILDQVLEPKTIDETEVIIGATAIEDQGVAVFLTQSGRVMEYAGGNFSFANTDDTQWQPAAEVAAYGRNIYLLSPSQNQIYKYSRLRSNYSNATAYNTDADLSGAISLAIDGNVYVLKSGGEILKLFKSKVQPFSIDDLAVDLAGVTQLFTSLELNHLYLLDPGSEQVVIVEKDRNGVARYVGQVVFQGLPPVNDLYVNKNEDRLYLLTDQAIYQIEL